MTSRFRSCFQYMLQTSSPRECRTTRLLFTAIALVFLLAFLPSALAQSDRGSLTGVVSDSKGSVIQKATASMRNADTGEQYKTITTDTGSFTISSLPAGKYDLHVEARGFKGYEQNGITISVAQAALQNVTLSIGSVTEMVTVTTDATLLKTENAEQSTTISRVALNEMPIGFGLSSSIRNPLAFAELAPGVDQGAGGGTGIRVNGLPTTSFHMSVDGMDSTNANLNDREDGDHPSVENVQEFTLQSSNFSAEFGQVGGGMFNFTSRSGTNKLHAGAYLYFENEDLNAKVPYSYITHGGNNIQQKNRQFDYGVTVGGPVYLPKIYDGRNKTFFFFNFEQYRQQNNLTATQTVPTALMRTGNFSEVLDTSNLGSFATDPEGCPVYQGEIYDPNVSAVVNGKPYYAPANGANTAVGTCAIKGTSAANVLSEAPDPVAAKIQALIPAATLTGTTNNYAPTVAFPTVNRIPAFKIDQVVTQNWKMSFSYSNMTNSTINSDDGLPLPISGQRNTTSNVSTYRFNNDYAITPNLLVHAGAGYTRFLNPDSSPQSVLTYNASSGLGLPNTVGIGFPRVGMNVGTYGGGVSNGSGGGYGPTQENLYWMDHANGVVSAIWTRGSHTIKGGAEYKLDMWIVHSQVLQAGSYNFSGNETAQAYNNGTTYAGTGALTGKTAVTGLSYASFYLGQVDGGSIGNAVINQYHRPTWALYLQDTWKVTPRLTVDYGLRWDFTETEREHGFRTSGFSPDAINENAVTGGGSLKGGLEYEGFGNTGQCNCYFMPHYPYEIGPRLAAAYQIDGKTVVRAGWGLTYGQAAPFDYAGSNFAVVSVGFNTLQFSSPSFGVANTLLKNGFQYNSSLVTNAAHDPGYQCCSSIINSPSPYFDRDGGHAPRINNYTLSLQREINNNLVVELAYVGNRGVWEMSGDQGNLGLLQLNSISAASLAKAGLNPTNPIDAYTLSQPFSTATVNGATARGFAVPYNTFPTKSSLDQALRPYPQWGTIYSEYSPKGKSWYDSLQIKVTKRFSHGLQFLEAFTYNKELDLGQDTERGRGAQINDALNRDSNKFLSAEDTPFISATSFTYEMPYLLPRGFMKEHFVARELLGGWTIAGLARYANGGLIRIPGSSPATNCNATTGTCTSIGLGSLLQRGTYANAVPGQTMFLVKPNCHSCIAHNAYNTNFLNPNAWVEPSMGTFGSTAPYLNNYRWQRQPQENVNLGKKFAVPMRGHEDANLQIRAEFFNIFNRTMLPQPSSGTFETAPGTSHSGFGQVNPTSLGTTTYRTGQIVARFTF
jgi:Carboxypeptidase regulatory-like domain